MTCRVLVLAACAAFAAAQCSLRTSCSTCAGTCVWCQVPSRYDSSGSCVSSSSACPSGSGKYFAADACPSASSCSYNTTLGCASCTGSSSCEWWSPGASGASGAVCASFANTLRPSSWYSYVTPSSCAYDPTALVAALSSAIIAVIVIAVLITIGIPLALFVAICICGCALCGCNRRRSQYVAVQQQQVYSALAVQPGVPQAFPGGAYQPQQYPRQQYPQYQPQQQYHPQQQFPQPQQFPQQYPPQAYAPPPPYSSSAPPYVPGAPPQNYSSASPKMASGDA